MAKITIKDRFCQVPNSLVNRNDVSLKAKGLYAYIQSKPDDWDFSAEMISNCLMEGVDSVRKALNELEDAEYLRRVKSQNEKGFWSIEYTLYCYPYSENPVVDNPMQENPTLENTPNNNKKEFKKKELNKNTTHTSYRKWQQEDFKEELKEHLEKYGKEMLNDFYRYWSEKSASGKLKVNLEKTWETKKRLETWFRKTPAFKSITKVSPPDIIEVERLFQQQGGTKEMSMAFFNKHSASNWQDRNGQSIKNYTFLIPNFIATWHEIRENRNKLPEQPKRVDNYATEEMLAKYIKPKKATVNV